MALFIDITHTFSFSFSSLLAPHTYTHTLGAAATSSTRVPGGVWGVLAPLGGGEEKRTLMTEDSKETAGANIIIIIMMPEFTHCCDYSVHQNKHNQQCQLN